MSAFLGMGLSLSLLSFVTAVAAPMPDLVPWPSSIALRPGQLTLDSGLLIVASGPEDELAHPALEGFATALRQRTGIAAISLSEELPGSARARLVVEWQKYSPHVQGPGDDESYWLEITSKEAKIRSVTPLGILRGLETVLQCVQADSHGYSLPALIIHDRPRFAWRGLMLDCARHFIPVADLKRTLVAMAAVKLNVLHWHLTDDQGFRLESKAFPKLAQAGFGGQYYTQADVREIVKFAHSLGIRIVPEFDMPGHATSWLVGYPNLASGPGPYRIETHAGLFQSTMDPTRQEIYDFLDVFFGEIAGMFQDEYVHLGGDEVDPTQWRKSGAIRAFERSHRLPDESALQSYFTGKVQHLLASHGKKMIGWEEVLQPNLARDAVVQAWRGTGSLAEAVRTGHDAILSFGYYLDQLRPASAHYLVDPYDGEAAGLGPDERIRILGGEACLWTEFVSSENLDLRLWPRTAAIAERLWSPGETRGLDSLNRRLKALSSRLESIGVRPYAERRVILERLAGKASISPLEVLLESLAPVHPDNRTDSNHVMQVPLSRLVDVAEPESEESRRLVEWVADWKSHSSEIRALLESWRANSVLAKSALQRSPSLKEAEDLGDRVYELSSVGLDAMNYLERRRRPAQSWVRKQRVIIEHAALPQADLAIKLIEPVRTLVAKAENPSR